MQQVQLLRKQKGVESKKISNPINLRIIDDNLIGI